MRQEAKLIPTTRATRGYRYCRVLETPGGRGFLLLVFIPWLRAILMDKDVLKPEWPCTQFQRLGLSGEIPKVIHDSSRPWVGLFM